MSMICRRSVCNKNDGDLGSIKKNEEELDKQFEQYNTISADV